MIPKYRYSSCHGIGYSFFSKMFCLAILAFVLLQEKYYYTILLFLLHDIVINNMPNHLFTNEVDLEYYEDATKNCKTCLYHK
jgi:hypothetical protein